MTSARHRSSNFARFSPVLLIGLAAATVFLTGAHRYLSLDSIREHRGALQSLVENRLALAIALFALAYVAVAALSLPGATPMSLLGGFLFGPIVGTVVVVVAATIGAVIIFSAARSAIGDALKNRAGPFARRMEDGFRKNAFSYLLLLRLIPVFPFFAVNIAPALFEVRLRTFALATFIGIIPGAFAFVSAGNGLGAAFDRGEDVRLTGLLTDPAILTPIVALSLLAAAPIALKAFGVNLGSKKTAQE